VNGRLSIVATPIGNLDDLTIRAQAAFQQADFILCEDTRVTRVLLDRFGIAKPLIPYHQHSRLKRIEDIIEWIQSGKNAVLVSDAGTPGVADPGNILVARAVEAGISVEPIPGPSALTALLSVAGVPTDRFTFLGFLPHKKGRETLLKEIGMSKYPVLFFESTHRIIKALDQLNDNCPERLLVVGRELTKIYEEVLRGTAAEVKTQLSTDPKRQKGEFIVLVRPETSRQPEVE
jgi:16S rRNA (cytidine1402-2'-O)-methyltransferase